jgi:hypothetical protein
MMFYLALFLFLVTAGVLLQFNEAVRERLRAHDDTWRSARLAGPSGLSAFQLAAEDRLRVALAASGRSIATRMIAEVGDGTMYVEVGLAGPGPTIWLYSDMAIIGTAETNVLFEEWDADTPAALAALVAVHAATAVARESSTAA